MLSFAICIAFLARVCLAETEPGVIGMGIPMYEPTCAYACSDSLSPLYLSCTTFDNSMDGMNMGMKLRKRMDMKMTGTTSSACRANNTVWLHTMAYCVTSNCALDGASESSMETAWGLLAADGDAVPSLRSMVPDAPPTVELEADALWLNETQLVNGDLYTTTRLTEQEFAYQEKTHEKLAVIIMAVTVGAFLLGGTFVAFNTMKGVPIFISKYITLPALLNSRHQVPLPHNIGYAPTRGLSLFIAFYLILNLIACCVPYHSVQPSTWYATRRLEISAYVSNRTGVLSIANLALAILAAGRNNPILLLSGFSQTTFLTFHRWSARVGTIQAVIHSIIYTYTYIVDGGSAAVYATIAAEAFYWWGIIGTIALALCTTISVLPLRLRFYDSFLVVHILLAILALLGTWYHIYLRFEARWGYKTWVYICFAFWLFDRFARFGRVIFYNWMGYRTESFAELLPGGEFVKLIVFPGRTWNFAPGQHSFIYFPGIANMWESHPFSISGWTVPGGNLVAVPAVSSKETERSDSLEKGTEPDITTIPVSSGESTTSFTRPQNFGIQRSSVTFVIRPHTGATKSLHAYLAARGPGPQPVEVLTEGPYGHTANLKNFDRVLCIGGGIGVTALLPYIQTFVSSGNKVGRKQGMMLAWTAKENVLVETVRAMIPASALAAGLEQHINTTHGDIDRMDVGAVVRNELSKVERGGRLAVVVCGPASLADEVRRGVVACIGENGVRISLFEESFTW